ncbi:MAG: ornithine carbamoyltransferase [Actinobacteria bacterium]|nr:ornithine carbamoyltransferase [Actinomycetota bacterium]
MKDLLRTEHLTRDDVELLLDTAAQFAAEPLRSKDALAHKSVAIYMTKPSTRTRLASQTAVAHLGGSPIVLRGDDLQLGRGESIADTARIFSGYCDAIIVRTFAQSDVDELGKFSTIPVINALTDDDHPTQLLADWLTIRETFGKDVSGRKFVYLGDGNNMAQQAIETAQKIAAKSGATIEVTNDPESAAKDASVLYTDVWMSMGDPESEKQEKIKSLAPFAVTDALLSKTSKDSIFMHCLPAHRGEEVMESVIDGPKSVIWREAFHRRTTIQSLLFHLTRGEIKGSL